MDNSLELSGTHWQTRSFLGDEQALLPETFIVACQLVFLVEI